jgi:hypothetical protein
MDNPIVANILGILGAVCWTVQVYTNYVPSNKAGQMLTDVAADSPDCHQLPPPQCHWPSAYHDDAVGMGWCATGRIQHRRRFQRCPEDSATDPHLAESGNVDPVLLL